MEVTCQVNTQGFEAACLALAKVSGRSMEEVVTAELGKVIDRTIELTPSATISRIRGRFEASEFTAQSPSIYTPQSAQGRRSREKVHLSKNGKIIYKLSNRYPAALWRAITERRKESLRRKLQAIGLAKKSWWNIAQALGLPVKSGRFVSAIASTGKEYPDNFVVSKTVTDSDIAVAFINAQPTVNAIGGRTALQRAIDGRVKYFLASVKLGVFDSMQKIAKQYPGLKING